MTMTTQTFTKQDVPASKLYLAIFLSAALFFFMISLLTGCYGAKDNEKEKSTIAAPAATPVRGTIIVIPAVYSDFSSPYKNKS